LITLINADFRTVMKDLGHVRMIFSDPPDGLGLAYNGFKDDLPVDEYRKLLRDVVWSAECADVFWLSFNSRHTLLVGELIDDFLKNHVEWEFKPCVQSFTFFQHNQRDLGDAYRPLYRLVRPGVSLYPDAIRIASWRQLNGDKRADPRGCVPGSVFDFPRVTGNSKQRRSFSPTQLHEGLYERCIKLSCKPGDTVVDIFGGSGTLGRTAGRCGVDAVMVEVSTEVCESIALDQGLERVGSNCWGLTDV
jgi:site-specific DNA-methyltransferase (adenine-specific)